MGRRAPSHIDDAAAVGKRIAALRRERGLSLRQLAFDGCSVSFLSRVEGGDRVASPPILRELARRLGVRPEEIAGRRLDGTVRPAQLTTAEAAVRMGDADAGELIESLLSEARELGDREAESRALEALGSLRAARGEPAGAAEALEHARDVDPEAGPRSRPALFEALGQTYAERGDVARAIAVLREALEDAQAEPADASLVVRFSTALAAVYAEQGRAKDAEALLAGGIAGDPELAEEVRLPVEWSLARRYARDGRDELAERYSRSVLERLERRREQEIVGRAHLLRAGIALEAGDAEAAEASLERAAVELGGGAGLPERARIDVGRSRAALLRGDHEAARTAGRRALETIADDDPEVAGEVCIALASIELEAGALDEARILCQRALDLLDDERSPQLVGEACRVLSNVEERAGDLAAALAALRRVPAAARDEAQAR